MMEFQDAVAKAYQHRGPLSGAAETDTHWLFSPAHPDQELGPTFVNRETGELEQYDTDPRNWRPRLQLFRAQNPQPRPIPEQYFGEPEALEDPRGN